MFTPSIADITATIRNGITCKAMSTGRSADTCIGMDGGAAITIARVIGVGARFQGEARDSARGGAPGLWQHMRGGAQVALVPLPPKDSPTAGSLRQAVYQGDLARPLSIDSRIR